MKKKKKITKRLPSTGSVVGCETCVHWQRLRNTSIGVCAFGQASKAIPFWAARLQELTLAIEGRSPTCAAWKARK